VPSVEIRVSDLASGAAVIALAAKPTTIRPAKDKPASLTLTAQIGNVAAGTYDGIVTFLMKDDDRRWVSIIRLIVSEPLSVKPLELGKVEVGKTVRRKVRINNAGNPLHDVGLALGSWTIDGSEINPTELSVDVPHRITLVPGQTETEIDMAVTVSPFLRARGRIVAMLSLQRTQQQTINAPVTVEIVAAGEGDSTLLVAPSELRLTAAPGEIAKFTMRVKLAGQAPGVVGLQVQSGSFTDIAQQSITVAADFVMPHGSKLSAQKPVVIEGFFIAPEQAGLFTGHLIVHSPEAGRKQVSVSLDVK
jgi:hypothetical protein